MAYLKKLKVTYTRKRVKDDLLQKPVKNPKKVYELFKEMENETREKVVCLHLNHQLEILSYEVVGMGSNKRVLLDVQGIYRGALVSLASSIIIVHNHPNGSCEPSKQDEMAYESLLEPSGFMDIPMQDFIIIGDGGYYSFDEKKKIKRVNKTAKKRAKK